MKNTLLGLIIGASLVTIPSIARAEEPLPTIEENEVASYIDDAQIPNWAVPYVYSSKKSECMVGYPDNTFKADKDITRVELAVVMAKCLTALTTYSNLQDLENRAELIDLMEAQYNYLVEEIIKIEDRLFNIESFIAKEESPRDHYISLGLGLVTNDPSEAVVHVEGKLELVELGKLSLSSRLGFNSAYEVLGGLSVDADITKNIEVYFGGGAAFSLADAQSGVLTSGKGDGEAVPYIGGGVALNLSRTTALVVDAKTPLTEDNDTGAIVSAGLALKF